MRWGLCARAEDRGLGICSWEIQRNLCPDRTLIVEMGALARGFQPHFGRFPQGSLRVPFVDGTLDEATCRGWLEGLDAVLLLETAYDWRFVTWAREAGCATVLYCMPEFLLHHADPNLPRPTRFWNPTSWRQEHMPSGTVVVPMPVALDRLTPEGYTRDPGHLRIIHVAGHRAAMDRNGTTALLTALRRVLGPVTVTITGQDGRLPATRAQRGVTVIRQPRSVDNYWDLYRGHDVLVMPRRYGGLCLPAQEAMGAGLAVVMPDVSPNMDWPVIPIPATQRGSLRTSAGDIPLAQVNPAHLAHLIDRLPEHVEQAQANARSWAQAHSWDALRETWRAELASAVLAERAVR